MVKQEWFKSLASIFTLIAFGSTAYCCQPDGNNSGRSSALVLVEQMQEITTHDELTGNQTKQLDKVAKALRSLGQIGLNTAANFRESEANRGASKKKLELIDLQLDKIAAQKSSRDSRLFWHKSLEAAKADSEARHRPILSLRLLGNLDEDLSCANSRFFRTILYSDPEIADLLRTRFVLHWQSVREVPIVTVDFGDGRRLRQPIIGNSVHLVLGDQGRVFDALPGLVTPGKFVIWLSSVSGLHHQLRQMDPQTSEQTIQVWHRKRANRRRLESELTIRMNQPVKDLNPLDPRWTVAATALNVTTGGRVLELLNHQRPDAAAAMRIAPLKMAAEIPLLRMVDAVEPRIAHDSFFNLYGLQPKIDDWYTQNPGTGDYQRLTERIYEEIFLMPLSDPWLGLSPENGFIALDSGGRLAPGTPKSSTTTSFNPARN